MNDDCTLEIVKFVCSLRFFVGWVWPKATMDESRFDEMFDPTISTTNADYWKSGTHERFIVKISDEVREINYIHLWILKSFVLSTWPVHAPLYPLYPYFWDTGGHLLFCFHLFKQKMMEPNPHKWAHCIYCQNKDSKLGWFWSGVMEERGFNSSQISFLIVKHTLAVKIVL